jgi:mannose-6-phosphate isomerase-like protein (cupin superfamily)
MKRTSLNDLPQESVSHNPEIVKQVMLRSGTIPHLTNFSQARFAPGQQTIAHAHSDMWETYLVEAGEGMMRIDGAEIGLAIGTCVAVEPGEVHEVINTGSTELVLTYFGIQIESA